MWVELLASRVARSLEDGRFGRVPGAQALAWAWARAARVERPLEVPPGTRLLAVGGATLGGSGKTPLALACARALAQAGTPVVLVGHAYRASPGRARAVSISDDVSAVGDEALLCARAFDAAPTRGHTRVVVAPSRQAAVNLAASLRFEVRGEKVPPVLVVDGVSQVTPSRATYALLALDAEAPWGSGHTPPAGDLRAPQAKLLAACDAVVTVADPLGPPSPMAPDAIRPVHRAFVESGGVFRAGELLSWPHVARRRVGLVTAMARPARLLRFLARRGVLPAVHWAFADHGALGLGRRAVCRPGDVDLWIASEKCAPHLADALGDGHEGRDAPMATIDHQLVLPTTLTDELNYLFPPSSLI